ncbi:MAG: F0F1 ATP synthase subunit delta [Verrucomicrobia bacterium]|nr:F0F1 ATP synthase subunit delta [Verrucomicrobiota bacterium]
MPAQNLPTKERRLAKLLAQLAVSQDQTERAGFSSQLAAIHGSIPATRRRDFLKAVRSESIRAWRRQQLVIEHAGPLASAAADDIKSYFESEFKRTLRVDQVENSELIAGLRVRLDDLTFDSSVAGHLQRLAQTID